MKFFGKLKEGITRTLNSYFKFTPAVSMIVLICVAVFVIQTVTHRFLGPILGFPDYLEYLFGIYLPILMCGAFWQPVTYAFLHGSLTHIVLNLFTLLFFGTAVESLVGTKRFWRLFFLSSVVGGLSWLFFDIFEPRLWMKIGEMPYDICRQLAQNWGERQIAGQEYNICIGASAGVFGLIGAFTALCPKRKLVLLLFYVIPLKLQARFVAILLMIFSVAALIFFSGRVAHIAHIAGFLAGYAYAKAYAARVNRIMRCIAQN